MSALANHRLAAIQRAEIVSRYPRIVGRNARLGAHGTGPTSAAVSVRTDLGAVGWGLTAGLTEQTLRLIGRPLDELFDPAVGVIEPAAFPLDFALHDLVGHILDQPVYQMLGCFGPPALTVYDGAIYFDDLDAPAGREIEVILQNCANDFAAGFRAFKLKIGRGYRWMGVAAGLDRDIEVTLAVRAEYPEAELLVDANDGYTLAETIRYLEAVSESRLVWLEEPFTENRDDLVDLRRFMHGTASTTLLADGEAEPEVDSLVRLATDGLIDVLLMDVVSYGLTAWREIMPALVTAGVKASPHAWGHPLKTLYAAQIGAGLGNVLTVEGVPGAVEGVDVSAYRFDAGELHVPAKAGFGISLPRAFDQR